MPKDESESHDPETMLEVWYSPFENSKGSLPGTRRMKTKGLMTKTKTTMYPSYSLRSKMQSLATLTNPLNECENFFLIANIIKILFISC